MIRFIFLMLASSFAFADGVRMTWDAPAVAPELVEYEIQIESSGGGVLEIQKIVRVEADKVEYVEVINFDQKTFPYVFRARARWKRNDNATSAWTDWAQVTVEGRLREPMIILNFGTEVCQDC